MAAESGVIVGDKIVPTDELDTYATHRAFYGQGGLKSAADATARLAITLPRQEIGMLVYQEDTGEYWKLDVLPGSDPANWSLADLTYTPSTNRIIDADGDTYVDVELTADDDIIRLANGGVEWVNILTNGDGVLFRARDGVLADESGASVVFRSGAGTDGDADSGNIIFDISDASGAGETGRTQFAFDGTEYGEFFTNDQNDFTILSYSVAGSIDSVAFALGAMNRIHNDGTLFSLYNDLGGTPVANLAITGNGQICAREGDSSTPSYTFLDNKNVGIYYYDMDEEFVVASYGSPKLAVGHNYFEAETFQTKSGAARIQGAVTGGGDTYTTITLANKYQLTDFDTHLIDVQSGPIFGVSDVVRVGGAGALYDMFVSGTYSGATEKDYIIEITSEATPDIFRWSDDGGVSWTTGVSISGTTQALSNNMFIIFRDTTNHTVGQTWSWTAYPIRISAYMTGYGGWIMGENADIADYPNTHVMSYTIASRPALGVTPKIDGSMLDGPGLPARVSILGQASSPCHPTSSAASNDGRPVGIAGLSYVNSTVGVGYGVLGIAQAFNSPYSNKRVGVKAIGVGGKARESGLNIALEGIADQAIEVGELDTPENYGVWVSATNGISNYSFWGDAGQMYNADGFMIGVDAIAGLSTDFPNTKAMISLSDTTAASLNRIGLVVEAKADSASFRNAAGLAGYGATDGNYTGYGVIARSIVSVSADTGNATGVYAESSSAHTGGTNYAIYATSEGASGAGHYNWGVFVAKGDAYLSGRQVYRATTTAALTDDDTIIPASTLTRVTANAAVTLSVAPSIEDGFYDGQILILEGTSDANTITISDGTNVKLHNDEDVVLGLDDTIFFLWDLPGSNWIEISRSHNSGVAP